MFPWGADPEKALRAKYAHEDEAHAKRQREEQALRKEVQAIQPTPSFTAEWFEMLEALVSVTETAQLQRKAPNPKAGDVAGISGAAPTLWDKETVAVRLLLEEGKLNVCLRLLYRHRRQVTQPNFPQLLASVSKTRGMTVQRLTSNLAVYEGCLAKILACAYENVEVVQTTELSEAVEYAVYVLNEFCRGRCKDELGLLVPTCACYNLRAFALHMDQLGEKRVMLAFAHHKAVELVVELMHGKRAQVSVCVREGETGRGRPVASRPAGPARADAAAAPQIPLPDLFACCQFLHHVFDAECFVQLKAEVLTEPCRAQLLDLREFLMQGAFPSHEARTAVNSLVSVLNTLKWQAEDRGRTPTKGPRA